MNSLQNTGNYFAIFLHKNQPLFWDSHNPGIKWMKYSLFSEENKQPNPEIKFVITWTTPAWIAKWWKVPFFWNFSDEWNLSSSSSSHSKRGFSFSAWMLKDTHLLVFKHRKEQSSEWNTEWLSSFLVSKAWKCVCLKLANLNVLLSCLLVLRWETCPATFPEENKTKNASNPKSRLAFIRLIKKSLKNVVLVRCTSPLIFLLNEVFPLGYTIDMHY